MSGMSAKADTLWSSSGVDPRPFVILHIYIYIYINDLPNYLGHATPRLFADETSIIVAGESVDEMEVNNGWKQVS